MRGNTETNILDTSNLWDQHRMRASTDNPPIPVQGQASPRDTACGT